MAAFSGLWDGMHGDGYAAMPKSNALPPHSRGIIRTFMQRRAMHGHVNALGRNAPMDRARINAERQDITVPGTFDYDAWKAAQPEDDKAGITRDMTITNAGSHVDPIAVTETLARPTDATEDELVHTYDTTLNNEYVGDRSMLPITSPAWPEVISDGA